MSKPASPGLRGRWSACLFAACWALVPVTGAAVVLEADRQTSTDGAVQLRWDADERAVELQRAAEPGFGAPRTVYRGTDSASLRTGLPEGDHYYRLRTADGSAWSEPVRIEVRHHGALRTWGLFGLGAVVFLSVVGMILGGWLREGRDD